MANKEKKLAYKKKLPAVFISFAILIMGTASLFQSMSLDYYSVLSTLIKLAPACLALGSLGWIMGVILDKPKKRRRISYNNMFVNQMLKAPGIDK